MTKSHLIFLSGAIMALVAACAPISKENVAATARPADATADNEHFWGMITRHKLRDALAAVEKSCSSAADCVSGKLAAAWPAAAQYQPYCQVGATLQARAECVLEYEFWAKAGQRFYPSYQLRDRWASFDLTDNPTFLEWHNDRFFTCNPTLNKSQDVVDTCMRDAAKRDFSVAHDATKGCYYDGLLLSTYCYWIAGFDLFVQQRVENLEAGA